MKIDYTKFNIDLMFEQYLEGAKLASLDKTSIQYKTMKECFFASFGIALVTIGEGTEKLSDTEAMRVLLRLHHQVEEFFKESVEDHEKISV